GAVCNAQPSRVVERTADTIAPTASIATFQAAAASSSTDAPRHTITKESAVDDAVCPNVANGATGGITAGPAVGTVSVFLQTACGAVSTGSVIISERRREDSSTLASVDRAAACDPAGT